MTSETVPDTTLYGQYAGFVTRLVAFALDRLILTVVLTTLATVATFLYESFNVNQWFGTERLAQIIATTLATLTGFLIILLYDIGFWLLAGQTPGKRVMGVRILRTDGQRMAFGNAVRREIGYWISAILFLGYLWVIVDNRRQALHDKLAGTLVLYSWPEEGGTPLEGRLRKYRERRTTS
jgi:uncharacterized RDD family membrane protein YckC